MSTVAAAAAAIKLNELLRASANPNATSISLIGSNCRRHLLGGANFSPKGFVNTDIAKSQIQFHATL